MPIPEFREELARLYEPANTHIRIVGELPLRLIARFLRVQKTPTENQQPLSKPRAVAKIFTTVTIKVKLGSDPNPIAP
ncbi:MAG: hypothetical protein D6728_05545 [Cyanobacteria bacterium J055]|nr:MAG: hypothetical protein D6728_05545 [Cyanobacteria bacterium J055]